MKRLGACTAMLVVLTEQVLRGLTAGTRADQGRAALVHRLPTCSHSVPDDLTGRVNVPQHGARLPSPEPTFTLITLHGPHADTRWAPP